MGNPSVIILDQWLKEEAATTHRAVYKVHTQPFPLIDSKRCYMLRDYNEKGTLYYDGEGNNYSIFLHFLKWSICQGLELNLSLRGKV